MLMGSVRFATKRLAGAVVAVALSAASLLPVSAGASEAPPDPSESGSSTRLQSTSIPVDSPTTTSQTMWAGPDGSGYLLQNLSGTFPAYTSIARVDLKSGQVVAQGTLPRKAYRNSESVQWPIDAPSTVVTDPAGEHVFVAYGNPGHNWNGASDQEALGVNGLTAGELCVATGAVAGVRCFGGVMVLDAQTLEHRKSISIASLRLDGLLLAPVLRALSYAPPEGDTGGKLMAVVQEGSAATTLYQSPHYNGANVVYAVQFDVESGEQDWALRIDACRGSREGTSGAGQDAVRPNPEAIFRTGSGAEQAVFVGCHASGQVGVVVKIPLDGTGRPYATPVQLAAPDSAAGLSAQPGAPGAPVQNPSVQAVGGPAKVYEIIADAPSRRLLMKVIDGDPVAHVWWVFDTAKMGFVGTIGITRYGVKGTNTGWDPVNGLLYVLGAASSAAPGGLFVADVRSQPLAQALFYPQFAELASQTHASTKIPTGNTLADSDVLHSTPLTVWGGRDGQPNRIYARRPADFAIIEDPLRGAAPEAVDPYRGRTLDLPEAEGVTASASDGTARAYGFRALLVGGAEAAARAGSADPVGMAKGAHYRVRETAGSGLEVPQIGTLFPGTRVKVDGVPGNDACSDVTRDLSLAVVGPSESAVLDGGGGRAATVPITVDTATRTDLSAPVSRCSPVSWQQLWGNALFGQPPADEPDVEWPFGEGAAACVSTDEKPSGSYGDPVAGRFSARADCGDQEVAGWAEARGASLESVDVGRAFASFRIYRDPGRGMVSRVEAGAQGVVIDGVIRISAIKTTAESWANGREFSAPSPEDGQSYNANCDFERTAGTCFRRQLTGLWTPGYACSACGDEKRAVEAMNRAMSGYGEARFREPDRALARGADNGFIAAIQKPDTERFADLALNSDLLQTVVPGLEIVRYAAANRPGAGAPGLFGSGTRGRQAYQFAGVEVSSSYSIQCLLVYDEATNTCAGEKQEPGAIQVALSDPDGKALAGGAFEVRQDIDADGVLGLKDTLLPDGACVTTDDGVGTCTFESLQPGGYLVNQVAAPPGYAKSAEPFVVELASGEQRTVAFTNVSNLSTVELKATDENGAPVSGAVFAAYPDPDSDGKVAPDAKPSAECTTGADGTCSMQVPAGSYVLVQTSAPAGLEGIEPVAFTFASGGQVAAVTVVNYPPDTPGTVEPEASPVFDYSPPVDYSPPSEIVDDYVAPDMPEVPETVQPPVLARVGDTITQVIRAPGDALRLLARDPKEAVAWTAALALFCLAVMAVRRRQQAMALMDS